MLKEITKLKIIDNPYFGDTTLDIFVKEENVLSCIYGKNGSGKTSISNIIYDISRNSPPSSFLKLDNSPVTIENDESIFVFNEAYVDKNVRVTTDRDCMDAILLFGEAANIDDEIENNKRIIDEEEKHIEERHIELYDDSSSDKYIQKAYDNIKTFLQNNWAVRQQAIRKNKTKSPVNNSIITEIIDGTTQRKIGIVKSEYDNIFNSIKDFSEESQAIDEIKVQFCGISENELVDILNKAYDKRIANELSANLIDITNKRGFIKDLKEVLNGDDKLCPICLQPLSKEHKIHLLKAMEDAFDETIKNAIATIELIQLNPINVDLFLYSAICKEEVLKETNDLIVQYNEILAKYSNFLEHKKASIYESMNIAPFGLADKESEIRNRINSVNNSISQHNDIIRNYKENVEKLEKLNIELTIIEASSLVQNYKKLKEEKERLEQLNRESNKKIESAKSAIRNLNQKKKDYNLAKNEINKELAIIFSSKERLKLKEGEDPSQYYVYSKGKKIKLNKLSTGERNIIALCYFFEQLKSNCNINEYFRNKMMVVIDDPISSFDYENKLSVLSYLLKMIDMVLKGNESNKVIILSHERNIIYAINNEIGKIKKVTRKIIGKDIVNFNLCKNSNYEDLIREVYDFACSDPNDESFESKGNEIRKVLEAYATFNYKYGMDEFFSDEIILNRIKEKELRNYYKQTLQSLALNFASHTEQMTKQYPDITSFDMFSEEEQICHARNVLSFLFLIDRLHIERYFEQAQRVVIASWVEDAKAVIQDEDKN